MLARSIVPPSAKAPAAPELPSRPSDPAARSEIPASSWRTFAAARASSSVRPPRRRDPPSVTVVSPPATRTWRGRSFFALRASRAPTRAASPESRRASRTTESPSLRASRAAASSADTLLPTIRTRSLRRRRIVGPEPTRAGRSPGTSDRTSVISRAAVARPRPPPLIVERLVRRRLSSAIDAPFRARSRTARRFSRRVTPGRGAARSDEAPPDKRQRITSPRRNERKKVNARRAARRLEPSGSGCAAKTTDPRGSPRAACPLGRTTRAGTFSFARAARAIPAAAFPAAKTPIRESGPDGKARLNVEEASARATAAPGSAPESAARYSEARSRRARRSFTCKEIKASALCENREVPRWVFEGPFL